MCSCVTQRLLLCLPIAKSPEKTVAKSYFHAARLISMLNAVCTIQFAFPSILHIGLAPFLCDLLFVSWQMKS